MIAHKMGKSPFVKSREIISQFVGRIGELSDSLDAEESTNVITSCAEPKAMREAEIMMRVFGPTSDRNPVNYSTSTTTSTTSAQTGSFLVMPRCRQSVPLYSMGKNFSNQRTTGRWRGGGGKKGKGPKRSEIILLAGPNVQEVPRQKSKVVLQ